MKPSAVILAASFAANVALVAVFVARPTLAPPVARDFLARHFGPSAPAPAPVAPAAAPAKTAPRAPLWSALESGGDYPALIARLRAAGFPAAVIRQIIQAELGARYDARNRALQESDPATPFWKLKPSFFTMDDKRLIEMQQLGRERAKILRELFADPFFATDDVSIAQRRQFGNLSRTQIDQLQRIEEDYQEMMEQVRAGTGGIQLPEDREKLALLAREKRTDLAAVLAPAELEDYQMRTSQTTMMLRSRLGSFDASEAEFRALYRAQAALNEKFAGTHIQSIGMDQARREAAQQAFNGAVRAAFGEARFADYLRETDRDYQVLARLAQRENLPRDTVLQAFQLRDHVARESHRIMDDTALATEQKRSALQLLAQNTRLQVTTALGPTAGPSFVRTIDQWLNTVERGAAVKFDNLNSFMVVTDLGNMSFSGGPTYRSLPAPRSGP